MTLYIKNTPQVKFDNFDAALSYTATKNTEYIKTFGANNRVRGFVYANTQRALKKTKEGFFKKGFIGPAFKKQGAGGSIQGGRVFAKKEPS